jgi:hypothetical protein
MFGTPRDLQIVDGLLDSVLGVGTASSVDPPNSEVSTNSDDTSLLVNPMFYGERHCSRAGASVMNWRANTPLDSVRYFTNPLIKSINQIHFFV